MGSVLFLLLFLMLMRCCAADRGHITENLPPGAEVRGLLLPACAGTDPHVSLSGDHSTDFQLVPRMHRGQERLGLVSTRPLDREYIAMYELRAHLPVRCKPRRVRVQVEVTDVNDNTPYFTSGNRSVDVDELSPLGVELMQFVARDADAEQNSRLVFYLSPAVAQLHVVPGTGQVILVDSLLGLETVIARVFVKDQGHTQRVGQPVFLRVNIRSRTLRTRRTRALLEELQYTVNVPERVRVGQLLFTVPAKRFEYRRLELLSSAAPVTLEHDTGKIYLARALTGHQQVTVRVHNLRGPEWYVAHLNLVPSGPVPLRWTMSPSPSLGQHHGQHQGPYLSVVSPEAGAGTEVYRLTVNKPNQDHPPVQFTLIQGGEGCFQMDRNSGLIRTTGLPLTPGSEYLLWVQAQDPGSDQVLTAEVSVRAGLRAPMFTNESFSFRVPENTPPNQVMGVVSAVSFQRQELSFVLVLNPGHLFSVEQGTGALSLTRTVDFEMGQNLHVLQVRATEEGTGLTATTQVVVHITDENDCTPEFLQSIYSRDNVPETIAPGTSILQVLARDCDSGVNSDLSYRLHGEDFSISSGGVVSVARRLDYERTNHMYELVVVALDAGTPPRTGTASIRIRVSNGNDEPPLFTQNIYKTFLSEDAGPDTLVAVVHAYDADGDSVTYAITGGNEDSNFILDNHKGVIKLRGSPPPSLTGPQYILNITATDDNSSGGPYPLSSSAQVIIGINDINNNKPLFTQCEEYSSRATVMENQAPGAFVLRVQAEDADLGLNGEVHYSIMHRDGVSSGFNIDPDTGVITTAMTFDRERQREFTLSITATDRGAEPLIGICPITVTISDQNDNTPRFENSRYQYFLREDTPVGTSFLRAAAHDDDQGSNAAITYSLSNQGPAYLEVNPTTGWVYVNHPISQTSKIQQQIIATDGGNKSSSVDLTVTITNVHNLPPQWDQREYCVTVPENTARDAKIITIRATSPLGDPRVTYNLEEGQVPETNMPIRFYLKPNRSDGSASVLVAENLDYETTRAFTLRVRAQNVAAVPLASFTTVYVNVTDVNDNVPFFQTSSYETTVPEGAVIGTTVVQVSAADLDSGLHGTIRYSILGDDSGDSQYFGIDPDSGAVVTRASFDREQKASYLITVQSEDGSESERPGLQGLPNTDTAYVRIFVADVNDNSPQFERPLYEVSVEEDREVGSTIITITATDQDEGANAKLRYQLSSGPGLGWFDVDAEVGRVFVSQRLDFETCQRADLKLVASDGKWENETVLVINIINRNDEAPVFTKRLYETSVQEESSLLPLLILQVSAVDPDLDSDQSSVQYSLHGQGSGGEFTIDQHTGAIHALRRLDREERPLWRFLVLATDQGGAGLTGFADVVLEVKDVNDNAPFFPCPALEMEGCFVGYIPEGSPADTPVMEMRATDLDDGSNAVLTYSIVKNVKNEINLNLFSINVASGSIHTVLGTLDREKQDQYKVEVEARDGGGLRGTATATILVTDINDNPPVFSQEQYSTQVSEDLELNSEVLAVSASDADLGENAAVTFSIVAGDEDRKFFIETNKTNKHGVVKLKKSLDYEKPQDRTFNLTLKAEDADFYTLASCIIQVNDANDNAPVFVPQFYEVPSMSEDSPIGTIITQVAASDLDSGQNGRFSYSISKESDPNGQFLVDGSGWVVLGSPLDREKIWLHRIVVLATDMGEPALTGTAIVMLTVSDINDNAPEFEVDYKPIVWENMAAPQIVKFNDSSVLLHVKDRDASGNGAPFSIQMLALTPDVASFNLTDLGNGSAMLAALRMFDREEQRLHVLPVLIKDGGSPQMSCTQTLTVEIGDRNDNPHTPGHAHFIVYSYDGVLPETVLGKVHAPDPDDWGQKHYSFKRTPPSVLSLNQSSGQLTLSEATPPGSYLAQVRVSDHTWPEVTCSVEVEVRDLPAEAVRNVASIRIHNLTTDKFFSPSLQDSPYSRLVRVLSEILGLPPENLALFSLSESGPDLKSSVHEPTDLNVWIAAHESSVFYKPEKIHGYIIINRDQVEFSLGRSISQVCVDDCSYLDCSGPDGSSGDCSTEVDFSLDPVPLSSTVGLRSSALVGLVSLKPTVTSRCGCSSRQTTPGSCSSYPTNPCLNGGTCSDGPLGFRCECPPLLDGPRCEQTRRSFGGDGYSWFRPLRLCSSSIISLEFLSESSSGLLLYNGPLTLDHTDQQDYIALELIEGVPVLSVDHGSGSLTLRLRSVVDDQRWHQLDIISDGKWVELILDQCSDTEESSCRSRGQTPGEHRHLDVSQPLQLGGVKTSALHLHHHLQRYQSFRGCIRNVRVDSQVMDLSSPGESSDSTPGCVLTDGLCETAGVPSCGEHADCLSEYGSFSCTCHPGFSGDGCETVVPDFSLDGSGLVRVQLRGGSDPLSTSVQLLFRTRDSDGTLLTVHSRDHLISLEILNGVLSLRSDLGSGPQTLVLPGLRVDLGEWIQAGLVRRGASFTLSLEGGGGAREVSGRLGGTTEVLHQATVTVSVGGARDNLTKGFHGCLRDVRFNGLLLPLNEGGQGGSGRGPEGLVILEARGVTSGCLSDSCRSQPCSSPLRCVDLWRKHECRCPVGQMMVRGGQRCVPSPCRPSSCRHGAECTPLSHDHFMCHCPPGLRGHRCELGQVKGHRMAVLSPASILALSMCLLVFFSVLVAVTVWNQKGSREKFRKPGIYHVPTEESWEDIRENILNYNEEGGGEEDQNGYDISELKRPLCSSLSQSSSCTTAPLLKSSPGSQEEFTPYFLRPFPHLNSAFTPELHPLRVQRGADFRSYVSRIVWEADNDVLALPGDSLHIWSVEGSGSSAGSLSSLESVGEKRREKERGRCRGRGEEEEEFESLSQWGPKFKVLSDMYERGPNQD